MTAEDLERGAARGRDRRPAGGATARDEPTTEPDRARERSGSPGRGLRRAGAWDAARRAGCGRGGGRAWASRSRPRRASCAGSRGVDGCGLGPGPRAASDVHDEADRSGVGRCRSPGRGSGRPCPDAPGPGVPSAEAGAPSGTVPAPGAPTAGDEKKPKTETLGLDLNEILARRRVSGE
ncbi:hypothetical protein NKG05_19325 [Oerskovia sp. M15]